jgi:hypothetical protein
VLFENQTCPIRRLKSEGRSPSEMLRKFKDQYAAKSRRAGVPSQAGGNVSAQTPYMKDGRLADVLALIQVLAFDSSAYRSEAGLLEELQRSPVVGESWMALAREHPEFFRIRIDPARLPRVAIVARYVLDREWNSEGQYKHPPLETTVVNKLMELAVELHDKQLERQTRFISVVLPMSIAIIAAAASITSAIIGLRKPGETSPPAAVMQPAAASGVPLPIASGTR